VNPGDRPIELLFERAGLPSFALPAPVAAAYGGALGFVTRRVIANFVASVDGIAVLGDRGESGHILSGDSEADRFTMGLLRSCVDAIVVGAGTLRHDTSPRWTGAAIYPKGAALFEETRRALGLLPEPRLVVVTASGALDPSHPALAEAIIVTTDTGAAALRPRIAPTARIVAFDPVSRAIRPQASEKLPLAEVLAWLRADSLTTLLVEGGPKLFAALLAEKLVDELFLTISPSLFGSDSSGKRRSLVDGWDLGGVPLELLSARRHGSHLFLRYAVGSLDHAKPGSPPPRQHP
jgi:riboflavin biosynthesis pyrimidine reductase